MNQDRIWDYFQNNVEGDAAFNADVRYQYLANAVLLGESVLNIGVGKGGLEKILMRKGVDVSCLDPSEESIQRLKTNLSLGEKARLGYSQAIPFEDKKFDVVVMSEVLEHLEDVVLDQTMHEVSRVLKVGGRFIGTVPADENLQENVAVCPDCGKVFHRWGHVQSFSRERLQEKLSSVFVNPLIKREYFGNYEALNWKGRLGWIAKKIMMVSGIKGAGETFFFSAGKIK